LSTLINFYNNFKPENVPRAATILQNWEGEECELWRLLRSRYGSDPFTFAERNNSRATRIHNPTQVVHPEKKINGHHRKRNNVLDVLLEELGYDTASWSAEQEENNSYTTSQRDESTNLPVSNDSMKESSLSAPQIGSYNSEGVLEYSSQVPENSRSNVDEKQSEPKRHTWDYLSTFAGELYTVSWEENLLMELCDSVTDMALDIVEGHLVQILRQTALHSFMNAIALPFTLVSASNMIDETWTLAIENTDEAGKELAKSLLASQAGNRPVILMGFSMGARVIYSCLKELARHQETWEEEMEENRKKESGQQKTVSSYPREPASIVEDAILMGCPNHVSLDSWKACRMVVAGRLINCYSRKDIILSFMFQIKRMTGIRIRQVCGTSPVNIQGVENYDVTHLISHHSDYSDRVEEILHLIGFGQPSPSSLPTVGG